MSNRVDKHTKKFEMKEVHGKLVRVRILNPYTEEDDEKRRGPDKPKKLKKRYCEFCETEIFDAGKVCDLCGREF